VYLKSLTLKGFKSFADRTVMRFEPGVAAIVGPNGSGKSNISDAVLWVLGERNAKNLRGQSMEDVIFAGSSARKPVSVAEVELLLDNSDGTLPVDFAEVSIGRRMYRSGESEYLINGNVVRRMDVLDILHDSGMGTGTNSIISQGNLDSVLSSRPEDRRALIEEAAGILKHKERKAKSERKLAQMDAHLDRVNDITAEVERQLKPLERKAKKALLHEQLAAELAGLKLNIAVDDLRKLQKRWDELLENESSLEQQQAQLKVELESSEAALDELQQKLQHRSSEESNLNSHYRRAQSAFERLNSTNILLREKRAGYLSEAERLARYVEEGRVRRNAAQKELEEAKEAAQEARTESEQAEKLRGDLEIAYTKRVNERNDLRKELDTLMSEQRALVHKQETIKATQQALKENLSEKRARAQVIDAHVADAADRLSSSRAKAESLESAAKELEANLASLRQRDAEARSKMNSLVVSRDKARKELDDARSGLSRVSAERAALEELERASENSNAALAKALDANEGLSKRAALLSHVVSAPAHLDALVQALLGNDLQALLLESEDDLQNVVEEVLASQEVGQVSAVSSEKVSSNKSLSGYTRLIDELSFEEAYLAQVNALVGDVCLTASLAESLEARRSYAGSEVRFASPDGCIVYPNGKVSVVRMSEADAKNNALARRRALEAALKLEEQQQAAYDEAQGSNEGIEASLREAQTASLKISEELASLKGQSESARRDAEEASRGLVQLEREHERLLKEQQENKAFFEKAQPDSDELERNLSQVNADLELNKEKVSSIEECISPLKRDIVQLSEKVSDARLETARLSERKAYAERMVSTREQEITSSAREDSASTRRISIARGAAGRADALLVTLSSLSDAASLLSSRLEQESRSEQEFARGLHDQIAQATKASREVRSRFEAQSSRIADVRIEKGRLEVQVEAGINAITDDCGTSLETALALEPLENRPEAEQQAGSLERRIKNMGAINPDAAKEFEEVSKRYEYLSSQLEDMRMARKSLARIVHVIDERMRDDFIKTFEQVNENFSDIFSTLFPGGQAHLSLVDPDDLENTGVDVNAQPIGKRVKKMSLLSGGEKSMTAMALLFAVYRIRQTPFYILDEVEAALDDTNLRRLIAYINVVRGDTQFIMITHQRRTMESADILYGVSMQADGITKVLSQKLDKATRKEG
jgi:chromosome segregation protein